MMMIQNWSMPLSQISLLDNNNKDDSAMRGIMNRKMMKIPSIGCSTKKNLRWFPPPLET